MLEVVDELFEDVVVDWGDWLELASSKEVIELSRVCPFVGLNCAHQCLNVLFWLERSACLVIEGVVFLILAELLADQKTHEGIGLEDPLQVSVFAILRLFHKCLRQVEGTVFVVAAVEHDLGKS